VSERAGCVRLLVPLCFGGGGGVRVLLQESLGTVRSEVEEAPRQEVRVREGEGGFLPSLPHVLLAIVLQQQRREGDHAAGERRELSLSALAVVLPGFESGDGVWRGEGGQQREERIRAKETKDTCHNV